MVLDGLMGNESRVNVPESHFELHYQFCNNKWIHSPLKLQKWNLWRHYYIFHGSFCLYTKSSLCMYIHVCVTLEISVTWFAVTFSLSQHFMCNEFCHMISTLPGHSLCRKRTIIGSFRFQFTGFLTVSSGNQWRTVNMRVHELSLLLASFTTKYTC